MKKSSILKIIAAFITVVGFIVTYIIIKAGKEDYKEPTWIG